LTVNSETTLFCYSYAALGLFRFAKAQGWRTVLGQIDPGPVEERLVARLRREADGRASDWMPAPSQYWLDWREECGLADRIVVNSDWSRRALSEEGVPAEKIAVVPLAYSPPTGAAGFQRKYPPVFTTARPLRVLFLGQFGLRKGAIPLMDAMRALRDEPIEFTIVGPAHVNVPPDLQDHSRVRWLGAVPRGETVSFYQNADVFLFPTFSDGFGLTQLEAQAWNLPVITSKFCGEVVQDGRNGLLLPEVTSQAIAGALRECAGQPGLLANFAHNSISARQFTLKRLADNLRGLEGELGP
jgi:glycosyltransferase involved in cell wall biosynthesis